jgi:2-polyprenyl-3-methyl-5-hydroxy-6-metoxy-1,4-benzoquinol methylase
MTYTHGHHESVLRSHRWRTAENSAAYLIPHLHSGLSVLDVGCGPGTITVDFAARVAPGRVVGVDAAADVIAQARAESNAVEFATSDVYQLAFDDGTFDVVHAHQVLQHLADPVSALREMRRVCKPGGVVAVRDGDYGSFAWYPEYPALDAWRDLYSRVAIANSGDPNAGRHLLAWAHAAGFTDVQASSSTWCFATAEDRAWWGSTWAERMTDSAIAHQARAEGFATDTELHEIAEAWRAWAAHPDGWYSVLHAEILARA